MESNQIQEGQKISPQRLRWHIHQAYPFSLLCALLLGAVALPFSADNMWFAYSSPTIVLLIVALVSIFFDANVWRNRSRLGYTLLRFLALTALTLATFAVLILFSQVATYISLHYTVLFVNDTFSTFFGVSSLAIYAFIIAFIAGVTIAFTLAILGRRGIRRARFFTLVGLIVSFGGLLLHIAIQIVLKDISLIDIFNATDNLIWFSYCTYFLIGWVAAILGAHVGGFLRLGEVTLPRLRPTLS